MDISIQGYDTKFVTMRADEGCNKGSAATITQNGTVGPCTSGAFIGFIAGVVGDYALVQTSGAVSVPYSGTAPALGYITLKADANGGIAALGEGESAGRAVTVVSAENGAATIIL